MNVANWHTRNTGGKDDPLGIVQETEISSFWQTHILYWKAHKPESVLENETLSGILRYKWITQFQKIRPNLTKKKNLLFRGFCHSSRLQSENKRNQKIDKYQDLKKLRNMKVTVKLIAVGAFEIVSKKWRKRLKGLEMRGRSKRLQTMHS